MLNAESETHISDEAEHHAGNHCNGSSQKTAHSEDGELILSIPHDRHGRFDLALRLFKPHSFGIRVPS